MRPDISNKTDGSVLSAARLALQRIEDSAEALVGPPGLKALLKFAADRSMSIALVRRSHESAYEADKEDAYLAMQARFAFELR